MSLTWLLSIDGVSGDSTLEGYPGAIELTMLGWGVTTQQGAPHGGGAAGKAQVERISFTATHSSASPRLFLMAVEGRRAASARVTGVRVGERLTRVVEFLLEEVTVSGWHVVGGEAGELDSGTLEFGAVTYSYWPQRPDGSAGEPVVARWTRRI